MVKIFELTDKQLSDQIEKYKKILQELVNEKCNRSKIDMIRLDFDFSGNSANTSSQTDENSAYEGISFDQEDLDKNREVENSVAKNINAEEEEIAVTKLLKLSKEQLLKLK